jgi:hypothetical protein
MGVSRLTIQLAGDIASGLHHMHCSFILDGDIISQNLLVVAFGHCGLWPSALKVITIQEHVRAERRISNAVR